MDSKKTKILKIAVLHIKITYKMPSTEILREFHRARNCIHITVILYFHLESMPKSVSLKILGLKMDYITI